MGAVLSEDLTKKLADAITCIVPDVSIGVFISRGEEGQLGGRCIKTTSTGIRIDVFVPDKPSLEITRIGGRKIRFASLGHVLIFVAFHELGHKVISDTGEKTGTCPVSGSLNEALADLWSLSIMQDFLGISPKVT